MKPTCRLIAVDIDGTLLDTNGRITARVHEALARAAAAGVTVVLATGRRYRTSRQIALEAGLDTYVLCQHGTHIRRMSDNELVWSATLESATARGLVEVMREEGHEPRIFFDGYERELDFVVVAAGDKPKDMFGYTGTAWRAVKEFYHPAGLGITEVASFGARESLVSARDEMERRFDGSVSVHIINPPREWYWCLEAISVKAGKGNALLALAERLGIAQEETAAVGDDVNDIDMIEKAGVGIAMGNAPDAIKELADIVVADNRHDGLAEAVERLVDGKAT